MIIKKQKSCDSETKNCGSGVSLSLVVVKTESCDVEMIDDEQKV